MMCVCIVEIDVWIYYVLVEWVVVEIDFMKVWVVVGNLVLFFDFDWDVEIMC